MKLNFFEYSATKKPKYLVIFLHGYGANGENLLDLAHQYQHVLPEAHFISPNAPQAWEGGFPNSYQWFSLQGLRAGGDFSEMAQAIKNANEILGNFINTQLNRFQLTPENLFLVGFSQGAMMSMYHGLIMPKKLSGIVAYSGKLILPQNLGERIISKPEICLIHGEQDSVVPFSHFIEAKEKLHELGVPFEAHELEHLDHSIDMRGVKAGMNFVKKIVQTV